MIKSLLKKRDQGFTLVELMIVVAIIGVLAALAIYGVNRYLKHSKTAEAGRNLGAISTGAKAAYAQETTVSGTTGHQYPQSSGSQPASVPQATKASGSYTASPWTELRFAVTSGQYYQYTYTGGGGFGGATSFAAVAKGDLDGNGTQSSFSIAGNVSGGEPSVGPVTIVNEDE